MKYFLGLIISRQHYGSRLLFVDDTGEAAYGYMTRMKGLIATLKPSKESRVSINRQRGSLSLMEPAENVTKDDLVLVQQLDQESNDDKDDSISYVMPEGCFDDRFQNMCVLKVTDVCDSNVYGVNRRGIEMKVLLNNVFKIPEDWPWILADPQIETRRPECDNSFVKEESWEQLNQLPSGIEVVKTESVNTDAELFEESNQNNGYSQEQAHHKVNCSTILHVYFSVFKK